MALERNLSAVPPVLLTANGSTEGVVQVTDTAGFFVKQQAILQAPLLPILNVEIKRVVNNTTLWVGPPSANMNHRVDVSAYTVAAGSFAYAMEQPKAVLPMETRLYASYEQEPLNDWRVGLVDQYGNRYSDTNPMPVAFEGTISIGTVGIIGPAPDKNQLDVNADGSINVVDAAPILGPTIENISVPLANTEQFFTFPANTQKFLIKVRDGLAKMQVSYVSGDSGSNYITINLGCYYTESLNISGQSIYFQLSKPSNVVELLYWTQP